MAARLRSSTSSSPTASASGSKKGSTDVGDVSWLTPTAQIGTSCFAAGAPGHSWQNVSIGATSIGHKGLLCAGKVLAAAAIDLIDDPSIIEEAHAEFAKKDGGGLCLPDSGRRCSHPCRR